MIKIFSSSDVVLVSFYKSILDNNKIDCVIKNYYLTGGVGDLPANEVVPELWILDDNKLDEANALLVAMRETPWQCQCGEKLPGQFAQCWKCGRLRE